MNLQADLSEPLKFLAELEAGLRGPALQRALNKASAPLLKALRERAKARVGRYYSRTIALRKKAIRAQGGDFVGGAWVGIGHEDKAEWREVAGLWGTKVKRKVNTAKIAHLVEGGFWQAPIKKGRREDGSQGVIHGFGKYVAGEPIMKEANASAGPRFERDFEAELRRQVDQAHAKAARKVYSELDWAAQARLRKLEGGGPKTRKARGRFGG